MAKVIKIDGSIVCVGLEDGSIQEFHIKEFNFSPSINDEVEIYRLDNKVIINKVKTDNIFDKVKEDINNNKNKSVNKLAYCLLCLFLGSFGIHKFYAGKIGLGILYIIFSWTFIPSIVSFIELILAIFTPADSNGNILV